MWTVEQQLVFMVHWRELLDLLREQEDKVMEMQELVLLQVEDLKKSSSYSGYKCRVSGECQCQAGIAVSSLIGGHHCYHHPTIG